MNNNLKAIWAVSLGFFFFSLSDVLAKTLVQTYPPLMILFFSNMCVLILSVFYGFIDGGRHFLKTKNLKWLALRGLAGLCTGCLIIYSLQTISLDVLYTLIFLAPLWVTLLGRFFLNDKIGWQRLSAILFGFAVILCIFRPGADLFKMDALLILIASFSFAVGMFSVRAMKTKDHPALLALCYPLVVLVTLLPVLLWQDMFVSMTSFDMLKIFGNGAVIMIGLILTALGFQKASASSVVAPFHYTQIIWGVLFGYVIFGDVPSVEIIIGAGLLIISGIYLIRFEKKNKDKI